MSFILCEICLVPGEPWRLKARDLSAFYALNPTAFEGLQQDAPAWLCAFCWTRVCQCVHFIDTAITSRIFLSAKNRLAAIPSTDVHSYKVESLPYWEVGLKPPTVSKIKTEKNGKKRKTRNSTKNVLHQDMTSEQLSSFANSTDQSKSVPCSEVDLETPCDSKVNSERKEMNMDPNDFATNILKEVLSNLESSNMHALDTSSNQCSSFGNNIFLPPNSVMQNFCDHNSDPRVLQDELDAVIPEETIQTPIEKVKDRSNLTVKDTGESEFLRFLEGKQKEKQKYRPSISMFFDNVCVPTIQIKQECEDNIQLVDKELHRINANEKVQMSIEGVKEEPEQSEHIKESLIFIENAASSESISAGLSKKRRKEAENCPEVKEKVAVDKNTTAFGTDDSPVEDIQMLLDEVKEEPFETFIRENNKESVIFEEAVTSSKTVETHF